MMKIWYDIDPLAAELWVVEGPPGYDPNTIDPDNLPKGWRWISDDEWAKHHTNRVVMVRTYK